MALLLVLILAGIAAGALAVLLGETGAAQRERSYMNARERALHEADAALEVARRYVSASPYGSVEAGQNDLLCASAPRATAGDGLFRPLVEPVSGEPYPELAAVRVTRMSRSYFVLRAIVGVPSGCSASASVHQAVELLLRDTTPMTYFQLFSDSTASGVDIFASELVQPVEGRVAANAPLGRIHVHGSNVEFADGVEAPMPLEHALVFGLVDPGQREDPDDDDDADDAKDRRRGGEWRAWHGAVSTAEATRLRSGRAGNRFGGKPAKLRPAQTLPALGAAASPAYAFTPARGEADEAEVRLAVATAGSAKGGDLRPKGVLRVRTFTVSKKQERTLVDDTGFVDFPADGLLYVDAPLTSLQAEPVPGRADLQGGVFGKLAVVATGDVSITGNLPYVAFAGPGASAAGTGRLGDPIPAYLFDPATGAYEPNPAYDAPPLAGRASATQLHTAASALLVLSGKDIRYENVGEAREPRRFASYPGTSVPTLEVNAFLAAFGGKVREALVADPSGSLTQGLLLRAGGIVARDGNGGGAGSSESDDEVAGEAGLAAGTAGAAASPRFARARLRHDGRNRDPAFNEEVTRTFSIERPLYLTRRLVDGMAGDGR